MTRAYRGSGTAAYHPAMLQGIPAYCQATGVLSSRKIERATHDPVAFRFIAANSYPDHDTLATFRCRFLKDIGRHFVDVLRLAREMGLLKLVPRGIPLLFIVIGFGLASEWIGANHLGIG